MNGENHVKTRENKKILSIVGKLCLINDGKLHKLQGKNILISRSAYDVCLTGGKKVK